MSSTLSGLHIQYREACQSALDDLNRILEYADCVERPKGEDILIEKMKKVQQIND